MKAIAPATWVPRGVSSLETEALSAVRSVFNSLIVAGPGAGKTELLAQRASYLLETGLCPPPFRILAISFKRDAARNLQYRVERRCGPELAQRFESYTFDGWAKGLLDRFRLGLPNAYRPTENYIIDREFGKARSLRDRLLGICESAGIPQNKIQGIDVEKFFKLAICGRNIDLTDSPQFGTAMALAAAFWRSSLQSGIRSVIAFSMIGVLAELLLRTNELLLKALRDSYRFVFLDEFQDTTGSQYRLLHTAFHATASVITAVGDNKQRIMVWAGAQVGVFDTFAKHFSAHRHGLVMNYRSAPRLVNIQRHLIAMLEPESPQAQSADNGIGGEGECRILQFPNDEREASFLANLIAEWIANDGIKPADICILTRQLPAVYTAQLTRELQGREIESRVQNDFQDLLSEPLTIAVIDTLRLCLNQRVPSNWINLSALVLRLNGYRDQDDGAQILIHELSVFLNDLRPRVAVVNDEAGLIMIVNALLIFLGRSTFCRMFEQYLHAEFTEQIIMAIAKHLALYRVNSSDWSAALDAFEGVNCIPIMSIHKSKGLEYHSVIVVGLEDSAFWGIKESEGEDDRNFFVAFSRAKKRVIFTTADSRIDRKGIQRTQSRNDVNHFYTLLANAGVVVETIQ